MRFYTKAWYRLCAEVDDTDLFEAIPDKDYTQEDILALHEQLKEAYVEEARRIYDLPPEPPLGSDEDFSLEQLPDSLSSEIFALSKEERQHLRQQLEQMYQKETEAYQKEIAAFEARPPFDPTAAAVAFEKNYQENLEHPLMAFPAWVTEQVDLRLLALERMPESILKKLKKQLQKEDKARLKAKARMEREAKAALKKQVIPQEIRDSFDFHDDIVVSVEKDGTQVLMDICAFEADEDGMPSTRIIFEDAKVLEQDAALQIADEADDEGLMIVYLQQELYRQSDGTYEVHMLLAVEGQPCYLTIRCSDIRFEKV